MSDHDEILTGGNINKVVKVGETVRRDTKPNPYVNDLLKYLEKSGCDIVPRYLGTDEQGRQMFSYLEGVVPGNDYPEVECYIWSDLVLVEVAKLLRHFHDATEGFATREKSLNDFPDVSQHEVVCHNDFALYNVVFKNKIPAGIIDFDMAGTGPRLWDMAYTLYTSVPLAGFSPSGKDFEVVEYDKAEHATLRRERIRLFFDSYGMDVPANLKEWVISRIRHMCTTLSDRAAAGDPAFIKLVQEGHLTHYEKELAFLEKHFDDWC